MSASIRLTDVDLEISGQSLLSSIALHAEEGEVLALLGPSGCGKTTILRLILGFLPPTSGEVQLDGRTVSRNGRILVLPEDRHLAVVFQDLALWPHLSVQGNLEFGLKARRVPKAERRRIVANWLKRLAIDGKADRYPGSLSGGERQRVAIARALALEPRAVLLDEPLANIDARLKRELLGVFRSLFEECSSTVIYVTHDLREAALIADRIVVVEDGRVTQNGTIAELRAAPGSEFIKILVGDLGSADGLRGIIGSNQ